MKSVSTAVFRLVLTEALTVPQTMLGPKYPAFVSCWTCCLLYIDGVLVTPMLLIDLVFVCLSLVLKYDIAMLCWWIPLFNQVRFQLRHPIVLLVHQVEIESWNSHG